MNQNELDLYIELQPKLNEYRGEWQVGDKWGKKDGSVTGCVNHENIDTFNHLITYKEYYIWLPLPIDSQDPERIAREEKPRGLWGMLTSSYKELSFDLSNGPIETYSLRFYIANSWRVVKAKTPTEALLLCLKEQWKPVENMMGRVTKDTIIIGR